MSYSCHVCGQSFKTLQLATAHEYVLHKGRTYDCNMCHKKFVSHYKLKEHTTSTHTSLRPHKCAVCGEQFGRYSALSYHLQRKHERHVNVAGNLAHLPNAEKCRTAKVCAPRSDQVPPVSETESRFVPTDFDPNTEEEDSNNRTSSLKNLPSVITIVPDSCSLPKIADVNCFAQNISTEVVDIGSSNCLVVADVNHLHGISGHLPGSSVPHDALQPRPLQSESLFFQSSAEVDGGNNPYLVLTADSFSFYDSLSYSPLSQTQSHDASFYNPSGSTF